MHTVSICEQGEKYVPYWRTCVGAGRANEALRAAFQRHLALVQKEIGFGYLRFHALFHDDMFVARKDEQEKMIYNFQYIDDVFDLMLEKNIRPFVELSFFPDCMKGGDSTLCWWKGHSTPPDDFTPFCELVEKFVRHVISRYGAEEVHAWYFEVWNEPNLYGFWDGTKSQYFELYKLVTKTIKAVDPALRVGGPATSNFVPDSRFDGEKEDEEAALTHKVDDLNSLQWHGVWINEFLTFCEQNHLPVDFVSTHPYPTDFALDGHGKVTERSRNVDALYKDMTWLKAAVKNSAYPNAEIHLTEWSSSPAPRDYTHDYLQEAAFIVKTNLDCIGLADSLSYWVFTDVFEEQGAGDSIFHGGFGMVNYQGIVKPAFHAYRMLASLYDECVYRDDHAFVTKKDGDVCGLLYNYPIRESIALSRYPDTGKAEKDLNCGESHSVSLCLKGLEPGQTVHVEQLDKDYGWAYRKWQQMGSPEPPDRQQTEELRRFAMETKKWDMQADEAGEMHLDVMLEPWNLMRFYTGK